jgi:alpha-mannosidase
MSTKQTELAELNNKTIHVVPYTHADIAWVHPREWHIDRYVRVFDELLHMLDKNPAYRCYIDSWIELIKPYLQLRPKNRTRLQKHIMSGRIAVCGGHYGNVRSIHVGDETFIRNLQYGMEHWRKFIPKFNPSVYANLDVSLGHSQVPQLLTLAGLTAYFAQRPLPLMDKQEFPRTFVWQGLSGDKTVLFRQEYGGLYPGDEKKNGSWTGDWQYSSNLIFDRYLATAVKDRLNNIIFCVGSDDARPDRLNYGYDRKIDIPEMMKLWNNQKSWGTMRFSTPDEFLTAILAEKDNLKTVTGVLDPGDVCYNVAPKGRRGIWWLRELADRTLVDAEIVSVLAGIETKFKFPVKQLRTAWEKLLDYTPHAVQWVLRDDFAAAELALRESIDMAENQLKSAGQSLANNCLPMDAAGITVINTLPEPRKEIVPITILNSDMTRDLVKIVDSKGKDIPFQITDYLVYHTEISAVAELDVPACGYTGYKFVWQQIPQDWKSLLEIPGYNMSAYLKDKHGIPPERNVTSETVTVNNGRLAVTIENGTIVSVEDLTTGTKRVTDKTNPILDIVYFPIKSSDWSTGEGIPDNPAATFVPESVTLVDQGPIRWRITRSGKCGPYRFRQHVDLYKNENIIRTSTQIFDPNDLQDSYIGVSVPLEQNVKLTSDIPFGIEPRELDKYPYGEAERAIKGMFWSRTWANAEDSIGNMALLTVDGDKFYRDHGTPRRLIHFMARQHRFFEKGWEAQIDMYDTGGYQMFQHCLVFGDDKFDTNDLVKLADKSRHPLKHYYVPENQVNKQKSFLSVTPDTVRLNGMLYENKNLVIRLTQMTDKPAEVSVRLPVKPKKISAVDFAGNVLPIKIKMTGNQARFKILPWQIMTLCIKK